MIYLFTVVSSILVNELCVPSVCEYQAFSKGRGLGREGGREGGGEESLTQTFLLAYVEHADSKHCILMFLAAI